MAFFPRSSSLSLYGGEIHRKGGILLKARLSEWERELQYLRFRIAEWKVFGSVEHPDYYPFRAFLFQKVRDHLYFELKTFSTILVGCEAAVRSDDLPPLQSCADAIFTFRERISPGEITRHIHVEEWRRYSHTKAEQVDTPTEMEDMFSRIRNEIAAMERRSKEFKNMVDDLVRLVNEMRCSGRFVNRRATRTDPRMPATGSSLVHSSTIIFPTSTPTPTLADSRARLPPRPRIPVSTHGSPLRPIENSPSLSQLPQVQQHQQQQHHVPPGDSVVPSFVLTPRTAQNPHRQPFNDVIYAPHSSADDPLAPNSTTAHTNSSRTPPPRNTVVASAPSSNSQSISPTRPMIAETRARLPPPLEASPVPYRPPGQRLFSFFNHS